MNSDSLPFDEKSFSVFRYPPVLFLWCARVATAIAYQMQAVAVGWQIYEMTSSPLQLGYVGLMMFIPGVLLLLVVGQVVDRYNRRENHSLRAGRDGAGRSPCCRSRPRPARSPTPLILGTVFMLGAARAFEATTIQTLPPSIVPPTVLPQTMAGLSSAYQTATIAGPALGGVTADRRTGVRLRDLRDPVLHLEHLHLADPACSARALAREPVTLEARVRRHPLRAQKSDRARRHVARPVRGDVRRRDRAAADLRARHFSGRHLGAWRDARRARSRRRTRIDRSDPLAGPRDISAASCIGGGRHVRSRDHRVRSVDFVCIVDCRADGDRRRRTC